MMDNRMIMQGIGQKTGPLRSTACNFKTINQIGNLSDTN